MFDLVWKASLILIAAPAALLVLRRTSAASRHLASALALAGLAALPLLSVALPTWRIEVLPEPERAPLRAAATAPAAGPVAPGVPLAERSPAEPIRRLAAVPPVLAGEPVSAAAAPAAGRVLAVALWVAGALALLARTAAGLLRLQGLERRGRAVTDDRILALLDECRGRLGLGTRPRLVASPEVEVPVVRGLLRPTVLVPRAFPSWPAERVRVVLLHELAHVKRLDWPVLLLGRIVVAAYWFHPLAWYLERRTRQECERACDDLVVECGTRPSEYAGHLLSIAGLVAGRRDSAAGALAMARRSHLEGRLRSILDPLLDRCAPSRRVATLATTAALVLFAALAAVQLSERAYAGNAPGAAAPAPQLRIQANNEWVGSDKDEGRRAYERAYELHYAERFEEAIEAFARAAELGFRPATAMYNAACGHARLGRVGPALEWLEKAGAAGFEVAEAVARDADFDPLRSDDRFRAFVDRLPATEKTDGERADRYRDALDRLAELERTESTDGKAWFEVGSRLIRLRELDRAETALRRAVELLGESGPSAMYNLACTLSLAGRGGDALAWLDRALEAGFDNHERFLADSDLEPLRGDPAFERLVEKSELLSLERFPRRGWERSEYSVERWKPAIDSYRAYVAEHASSGRGWFNLGLALHYSSRFDEALDAFERARALGFRPSTTSYNLACGNARLGRTAAALDRLEEAVDAGFRSLGQLEEDDDLESLRAEPRFRELQEHLLEQVEKEHGKDRSWHERLHRKVYDAMKKLHMSGTV